MLVSNEDFLKIIEENDHSGILTLYDKRNVETVIKHPRNVNIIIQDTYNNPFFPLPRPRLDTSHFDTLAVYNYFRSYYSSFKLMMLPWHYLIEFCDYRYIVINTRPIDMKFPFDSSYAIDSLSLSDDEIKLFSRIELSECIHVCIIGDTNKDIYPSDFYKVLKDFCLTPILRMFKVIRAKKDAIHFLRIGSKINKSIITEFR